MLLLLLQQIRKTNVKSIAITVLIVVVLSLASAVKMQHDQLQLAKVVYANPKTVTVVKTVKVAGPVRIVTKIVERPTGERETTVTEDRGQVVETRGSMSKKEPVSLDIALRPPVRDRWLAGIGNRDFAFRSWENYSAWGGREMGRLVALAGIGYRDSVEGQAVLLYRF